MLRTLCAAALLVLFANQALCAEDEAQIARKKERLAKVTAPNPERDEAIKKIKEAIAAMKAAEITTYTLKPVDKDFDFNFDDDKLLYGWTVLKSKKLDDKELAGRITDILMDTKSYWNSITLCFTPGLAFRFKDAEKQITFVICLDCNWVYVTDGKDKQRWSLIDKSNAALLKAYNELWGEAKK